MAVKRVGEQYHAKNEEGLTQSQNLCFLSLNFQIFLKVELLLSYGKTDFRLQKTPWCAQLFLVLILKCCFQFSCDSVTQRKIT